MYKNMYKHFFGIFHILKFFCSLFTNIKFSIVSIPSSLMMMMMWLDDQLEECCPSLTSQMMMSHTVEELNCLWRSNIIKMLSISSTTCHIGVDLSGQ